MRLLAPLAVSLLLSACATTPEPATSAASVGWFRDASFAAPTERIDASEVFAVTDGMKDFIAKEIHHHIRTKGRSQALVEALRNKAQLKLAYDSGATRNAAQAFEERRGNCLSLVIMTAAFAREIGLPVRFQHVVVDETWSRSGDLYFSLGHVNLTLGQPDVKRVNAFKLNYEGDPLTVDFLPPMELRGLRWRIVDPQTIVAMYMNNRATDALAAGRLDEAYWRAREAIKQDPNYLSAYTTLGVIYQRRGLADDAARAFAHVLQKEPRNQSAMANLIPVLRGLGRTAEATKYEEKLASIDPHPAFSYFTEGLTAMQMGDYRKARDLFAKEVDRAPYYHEFHFWLAAAYTRLGEYKKAQSHLALAEEHSTTSGDKEKYAGKLERLRSSVAR